MSDRETPVTLQEALDVVLAEARRRGGSAAHDAVVEAVATGLGMVRVTAKGAQHVSVAEVVLADKSQPGAKPSGAVGVLAETSEVASRVYGTPSLAQHQEASRVLADAPPVAAYAALVEKVDEAKCVHGNHGAQDCSSCVERAFACRHGGDSRQCWLCQGAAFLARAERSAASRAWEASAPRLTPPTETQQAWAAKQQAQDDAFHEGDAFAPACHGLMRLADDVWRCTRPGCTGFISDDEVRTLVKHGVRVQVKPDSVLLSKVSP